MKKKLPVDEQQSPEELLWAKSGGYCFLCEAALNRASDDIEADHDVPESDGGETSIANLNFAHVTCNRAKRNAKTIPIKPFLKLKAFADKRRLRYDGFLDHFSISTAPVIIVREGNSATFELPDGSKSTIPVYSEENGVGKFEYVFLQLPRQAIYNDDACQPRALRLDHAWAIYCDLQRNPLHEPPSCRTEHGRTNEPVKLLMFDGQHKTIANWMLGRQVVTCKVYLNLTDAQANELVNSIQAKIKKLPLSPFELAGKMSDEWENKFHEYEGDVGSISVSEKGFLNWLPSTERTRGKQALLSALVQNILASDDLTITKYVKRAGSPKAQVEITEQQLKSKLIEKLLVTDALDKLGDDAQALRDAEARNIIECLNIFTSAAFEPVTGALELTPIEVERARRMTYQSSLAYIALLIRQLWFHIATQAEPKTPMTNDFSDEDSAKLRKGIELLASHPGWTALFDDNDEMKRLKGALERNQDIAGAFVDLGLDLSYLALGKNAAVDKIWGKDS